MADIVNLRTARKRKTRAEKEKQAAENRVHFGRPKADRLVQTAERAQAKDTLDGKRLDPKD